MDNLDFIYSLFNQYLFQDAKNNIEIIDYYVSTSINLKKNKLANELIKAIRNFSFENIDVPLFQSIMSKTGKSPDESKMILGEIIKWKGYSRELIKPSRDTLKRIIASTLINKINQKYPDDPFEYWKAIKESEFTMSGEGNSETVNLMDIDINSIIAESSVNVYPSMHDWINKCFQPSNGYEGGQLVMITMPPGCMSGDTEVFLCNGETKTLEELYKSQKLNIPVYSYNPKLKVATKSIALDVQITAFTDEWIEFELNNNNCIKVTPNHPLLKIDGTWEISEKLKVGDKLFPMNGLCFEITKKTNLKLPSPEAAYDLADVKGYSNYAVKVDGNNGIFSHNTGKSLFLMGEAVSILTRTQADVYYLCLGDMGKKDFIIRLSAILTGRSFYECATHLADCKKLLDQAFGRRLTIEIADAGEISVDDFAEKMIRLRPKVFMVDYDANFDVNLGGDGSGMYTEFGNIYNKLIKITRDTGALGFVAAQPMKPSWALEVINKDQVGESAKKIHSVDSCITAGINTNSQNHIGIFKMAKNRRGEEGREVPYIRLNNGRFKFIPRDVYQLISQEPDQKDYSEAQIDEMIRVSNSRVTQMNSFTQTTKRAKVDNPFSNKK